MSTTDDLIAELAARGLLKDVTDPALAEVLKRERLTLYCGFDPTGETLHIGNLVPLVTLRRFAEAGHNVLALIGGATGLIGDPSGRDTERELLDEETISRNVAGLTRDIGRILPQVNETSSSKGDNNATVRVANNRDWMGSFGLIEFLRDVGKHFRVNEMLRMDSVRDRLEREAGLSFTEFSYSLIQSYDFWHLYAHEGCRLQLGASDQWGNITSGLDFIRTKILHEPEKDIGKPFGLTLELLLDGQGNKFGKSTGGGSLWLSPAHTSPYRFYQYFLNTRDEVDENSEVERYLKTFTFLSVEEIRELMQQHNRDKPKREAQRRLAREVTRLVHGEEGVQQAEQASEVLFGLKVDMRSVAEEVLASVFEDVPHATLPAAQLDAQEGIAVLELFVATGLCASKGEARRKIKEGGAYVNDERIADPNARLSREQLHGKAYAKLRKGKREPALVRFA